MTRTMYDACDPSHIPADAVMVAGYIYGPCRWSPAEWARFPGAVHVRIATVASLNDGAVLDVESGDASPDLAVGWCARARLRGQTPTVYCNAATVDAVLAAFKAHDIVAPLLWIAQWDGDATVPSNAIAKQYVNDAGAGYDMSVVADHWPGVDVAPAPPPTVTEVPEMWMYQQVNETIWLISGGTRLKFDTVAAVEVYQKRGVPLYYASEFTDAWNAQVMLYPEIT